MYYNFQENEIIICFSDNAHFMGYIIKYIWQQNRTTFSKSVGVISGPLTKHNKKPTGLEITGCLVVFRPKNT